MTNEERPEGIWQEDWTAAASDRVQGLDAPDAPPAQGGVLKPRALPARLARGGRFSTGLARTLAGGPAPVLGNIASARREPMLTVQSKLPPERPTAATAPLPVAREPVAAPAPVVAPPPVRPVEPPDDGGIFGGIARFVLRRLKPRQEQEAEHDDEPAPRTPSPTAAPSTPAAAPVARSQSPVETPAAVETPSASDPVADEAPAAPPPAAAPEIRRVAAEAVAPPVAREDTPTPDRIATPPLNLELARRPSIERVASQPELAEAAAPLPTAQEPPASPATAAAEPVIAADLPAETSASIHRVPSPPQVDPELPAMAAEIPSPAPAIEAPAAPVLAREPEAGPAAPALSAEQPAREEPLSAPIERREPVRSPIANLALAIRRTFRPSELEAEPVQAETAVASQPLAREAAPESPTASATSVLESALAVESPVAAPASAETMEAPALSRFAILREAASETTQELSRPAEARLDNEPIAEPAAASFEASSEPPALIHRVFSFFRPRPQEAAAEPGSTSAGPAAAREATPPATSSAAPQIARVATPALNTTTPAAAAPLANLSPLAVARAQLSGLSRSHVEFSSDAGDDAAESTSSVSPEGGFLLRQASGPVVASEAGPVVGMSAAAAPAMVEIHREASPLIYRRSAFAAPPSSAAGYNAAFEGAGPGVEEVLREIERGGMTSRSTLVASAAIIQNQLENQGGGGTEGASEEAPAAAAEAAAPAASAAAPEAAAAADAVAAVSNQALDRLAREIYDRLRRRLIVDRERAGIGTVMS